MKQKFVLLFAIIAAFFFPGCKKDHAPECVGNNAVLTTTQKVIYVGLNDPRGLKFGPDGNLYVAEAGIGGTNSTAGQCTQVPPGPGGPGPDLGSNTGSRISKIDWNGVRTTVADNLPSSMTSPASGSSISGVSDVEFIGNTLYGLLSGAGCSHGVANIPNSIFRVNADKTWTMEANTSQFLMNNPVAHPDPDDFEPDGTPYSMVNVGGTLYFTEPNQQEIDRVNPLNGNISRVVDISILHDGDGGGWIGPTSMVHHDGNFYFGTLTPFPLVQGAAAVYKMSPNGSYSVYASGFTMILGVAFDNNNNLYVLENTVGQPGPTPGFGDVVRVDPSGKRQVVASGLNLPTAMTFGPDGKLYISDWGIGPPGLGQIVQVTFKCQYVQADTKN